MNRLNTSVSRLKALFLLTMLVFVWLFKPVHMVVEHHDVKQFITIHTEKDVISPDHHFDCEICEFEFCTFLTQDFIHYPIANFQLLQISVIQPNVRTIPAPLYSPGLRAPPVV